MKMTASDKSIPIFARAASFSTQASTICSLPAAAIPPKARGRFTRIAVAIQTSTARLR